MIALLVYLLVCGYVLIFSGSLFFEAMTKGGWRPEASDYDSTSLFLGYLFGFPSLMGVIGGITVLATRPEKMFRFKVLFFVPAVVWSLLLVLDILRRPLNAWIHGLYLLPAFLMCGFVLFNVSKTGYTSLITGINAQLIPLMSYTVMLCVTHFSSRSAPLCTFINTPE